MYIQHSTIIMWWTFFQYTTVHTPYLAHEGEIWGVYCKFDFWFIFLLSHCSAIWNLISYQTMLKRHTTECYLLYLRWWIICKWPVEYLDKLNYKILRNVFHWPYYSNPIIHTLAFWRSPIIPAAARNQTYEYLNPLHAECCWGNIKVHLWHLLTLEIFFK